MTDTVGIYRISGPPEGRELRMDSVLKRVAVASTTHLPFFTALGAADMVVGVAHADQVRDRQVVARIKAGTTVEIARAEGLDRERMIALDPQVLFDYPFGRGEQGSAAFERTIAVTEYLEEHPLGRAEWIRFFGLLLGQQQRADSMFAAIAHRYTTARDLSRFTGGAPKVLFGSHWEQRWYAPPGNSYMATLINDAGGRYWFSDSLATGNITVPLEEVLNIGAAVGHVGVLLADRERVDARAMVGGDPRLGSMTAVRKGGFVGNSAQHDLFGQALLEPEVVLQDLRCIFHPEACQGHKARYFFPVAQ
ncbi:MAG: ABC transporter substrate-binding protein [Flavobacteriales bacterium]|nr:ABC transporter substrate-binding protein [Flavobacteriales bacterium]